MSLRVGQRVILRDMDFSLAPGQFVAVLGPNGVGKTTLLRAIAGLHTADDGQLHFRDRATTDLSPAERAKQIAFMQSEEIITETMTVREVVAAGRYPYHRWFEWHENPHDQEIIAMALLAVRMESFASRPFATLSSGERQRIWLALGLAQEASLLLLDEPTSHLDLRAAHEILHLLREQSRAGKTVVSVLHDVNEAAEFADTIMLLGDERLLILDRPEAVLTSGQLDRAYGTPMELMRSPSGALRAFPSFRPNFD
ncbi:MAG: ABC transporter ATP-binding protein [Candidatus Eremiobacteraeota bacterium]|nr:ABC transporter ATP-binding protein [Candidatus Eremiobacteraeota bacterium]